MTPLLYPSYRPLQTQELEVLQVISDQDLAMQSSTPLYAYIFTIRLLATTAKVLLHFDLTRLPNITMEAKHGLSGTETQKLTRGMEKLALEPMRDASCTISCSLPLTLFKTILRINTIFRPNDDSATG
ncbi:hypothetical protein DD237_003529 [Peronospora effusa]|uniref:Uncharacterized protein n=1 Tax=Peronospora effusa TaxID=542832 RepID=A0A425BWU3_9STRA|nr:hypothetical protein DD237_003529 [Peronospora effusa]